MKDSNLLISSDENMLPSTLGPQTVITTQSYHFLLCKEVLGGTLNVSQFPHLQTFTFISITACTLFKIKSLEEAEVYDDALTLKSGH